MSHLTPVQRPDKNGVIVTRHVRMEGAPSAPSAALKGAVPFVAVSERSRRISALAGLLGDAVNEVKLDTLSDEAIGYFSSLAEHADRLADTTVLWRLLNPEKTAGDHYMEADELPALETDLQGIAQYHRMDRGVPLNETLSFVRGMHFYTPETGSLPTEQGQALIDASVAALKMLGEKSNSFEMPEDDMDGEYRNDLDMFYSFFGGDLENERDGQLWIRNPKFVDMMLRRPEDTARISEVMVQRKTIQADIIETILDSDNHEALIEGTL